MPRRRRGSRRSTPTHGDNGEHERREQHHVDGGDPERVARRHLEVDRRARAGRELADAVPAATRPSHAPASGTAGSRDHASCTSRKRSASPSTRPSQAA